mgnify:CR=1 FL=1
MFKSKRLGKMTAKLMAVRGINRHNRPDNGSGK